MAEHGWYSHDGTLSVGPVEESVMIERIRNGTVQRGCLVWKEGMAEWAAVENTSLSASFDPGPAQATDFGLPPPPLPPPLTVRAAAAIEATPANAAPANAAPAWAMAAAPVGLLFLSLLPGFQGIFGTFFGAAVYIGLSVWDIEIIKASGRTPSRAYWWPILIGAFGAPVYLWLRTRVTGDSPGYFIVSLLSLIFFIGGALRLASAAG